MRVTIEQPRLLKSLQAVERAVNDRSALPILANILLETKEGELVLTATDLDVGVQHRLPLTERLEQGAVTLPARRLSTIIRELPEEPVTVEAKKNHTTTLSCGATHFRLQGLPPEDFPMFPSVERGQTTTIPQAALKQLVASTIFAMSMEETRFVLNGTLMELQHDKIVLVATDGRRLAVAEAPLTAAGLETRVVVPSKTMRELGRLLEDAEGEPVTIAPLKDNQLLFQFGDVTMITRLIDGQFPQYQSVIPAPSTGLLRCNRQGLASAIRRANLMTTAASQAILFEIAKDRLTVSKESPELGSAREELPASFSGPPMTVAFNPEFWLDALKTLVVEELAIELTSPEKPAVLRLPRPEDAGGTRGDGRPGEPVFLYVVLPMKLA